MSEQKQQQGPQEEHRVIDPWSAVYIPTEGLTRHEFPPVPGDYDYVGDVKRLFIPQSSVNPSSIFYEPSHWTPPSHWIDNLGISNPYAFTKAPALIEVNSITFANIRKLQSQLIEMLKARALQMQTSDITQEQQPAKLASEGGEEATRVEGGQAVISHPAQPVREPVDLRDAVFRALENPNYRWRTVSGVAREIGAEPAAVEQIILFHRDQVVRAPMTATDGATLFTTRPHFLTHASPWEKLRGALKLRLC